MRPNHFTVYPNIYNTDILTTLDKNLPGKVTAADEALAINTPISGTPTGYVIVEVNGKLVTVGNGVKTNSCYFSGDGGATARLIADIAAGDTLHWVGSVAKYQLDTADRISLHYEI